MATPRIFISMGTPYTEDYARFRDELESLLRDRCGVDPRIIGKNEYPSGNPLHHIRSVMRGCAGVVIVAYERKFLEKGVEKRGGPKPQTIDKRAYTTPWNHIESAIAYSLELPIYIFCQHGLAEEGLIETKIDWYVQHVHVQPGGLSSADVLESVRAWVNTRVIPRSKRTASLRALQGQVKLSEMTPRELWTIGGLLLGAFALGVTAGKLLPSISSWFVHP